MRARRFRPVPPGTPPDPVQDAVATLTALPPGYTATGAGVDVAVFDTWPVDTARGHRDTLFGRISAARARVAAAGGDTTRLQQVLDRKVVVEVRDVVQEFGGDDVLRCHPTNPDGTVAPPFDVSDHGLFVAGIISDIAPDARITVYRVLDSGGIGDVKMVAEALEEVLAGAEGNGAPLVINLSLGFAPELTRLDSLLQHPEMVYEKGDSWLKDTAAAFPSEGARQPAEVRASLHKAGLLKDERGTFDGPLALMDYLFSPPRLPENVLVVAAAGNNSHRPRALANPRLPAAVEGVLGVSATTLAGTFASYSNADDLFSPDDGIGAFGGDVDPATGDTRGGVIGLYVSEKFPVSAQFPSGEENNAGWAEWSGTSFATPVVTGIAACTWQAMGAGTTGQALMNTLVVRPDGTHPAAFTTVVQE